MLCPRAFYVIISPALFSWFSFTTAYLCSFSFPFPSHFRQSLNLGYVALLSLRTTHSNLRGVQKPWLYCKVENLQWAGCSSLSCCRCTTSLLRPNSVNTSSSFTSSGRSARALLIWTFFSIKRPDLTFFLPSLSHILFLIKVTSYLHHFSPLLQLVAFNMDASSYLFPVFLSPSRLPFPSSGNPSSVVLGLCI